MTGVSFVLLAVGVGTIGPRLDVLGIGGTLGSGGTSAFCSTFGAGEGAAADGVASEPAGGNTLVGVRFGPTLGNEVVGGVTPLGTLLLNGLPGVVTGAPGGNGGNS